MKTKGSAITRRIIGIGITALSMVLVSGISAFAMPADPDSKTPTAPVVPLQSASSGRAWLIPLIIGGVVVLAAALIGRLRIRRSRGVAWGVE